MSDEPTGRRKARSMIRKLGMNPDEHRPLVRALERRPLASAKRRLRAETDKRGGEG
jgi:hypothetical protein